MAKTINRKAPGIRLLSKRRLKAASFIIVKKREKVNTREKGLDRDKNTAIFSV
jgi:hypothetical protein